MLNSHQWCSQWVTKFLFCMLRFKINNPRLQPHLSEANELNCYSCSCLMMTSSNGNIFRVTGPLCGEFTGPGEFPTQRPVTRSFDAFFDLRLNKRLSKQPWGWWFETLSCPLWRHCNGYSCRCLKLLWGLSLIITPSEVLFEKWSGRIVPFLRKLHRTNSH